jgi:hypothetical protein
VVAALLIDRDAFLPAGNLRVMDEVGEVFGIHTVAEELHLRAIPPFPS